MDKSEKYIKMCEKAEKIQKEWKPKIWDIIHNKQLGLPFATIDACKTIGGRICAYITGASVGIITQQPTGKKHSLIVWLPTQDQLQGMVGQGEILDRFYKFVTNPYHKKIDLIPDELFLIFEQLWLAFVMYEKYGKIWSDEKEDWEKKI